MAASNGPYQVYPGQSFVGSQVFGAKGIFAKKVITTDGLAAGGAVPTVAALTAAGTGGAISAQAGYDQAGSFVLTAGTSPAAGSVASVTFGEALSAAPVSVVVTSGNQSAGGAAGISAGVVSVSKTGFTVFANTAGTLSGAYLINYQVIRSPF